MRGEASQLKTTGGVVCSVRKYILWSVHMILNRFQDETSSTSSDKYEKDVNILNRHDFDDEIIYTFFYVMRLFRKGRKI